MSKTISITIPDQLEKDLQEQADLVGISRSRFICNLLLEWQIKNGKSNYGKPNDCIRRQENGNCLEYDINCQAPQCEAETCAGYAN